MFRKYRETDFKKYFVTIQNTFSTRTPPPTKKDFFSDQLFYNKLY